MTQLNIKTLAWLCIILLVILHSYQCSVTYRVVAQDPNKTEATIVIKEQTLYWTVILRYNTKVRLRVKSGGRITSSSPEGNIYVIGGNPITDSNTIDFIAKYDRKSGAKLISATFNRRPIKLI
ncbi:uncharacterized protein LOC128956149 [Oppia nitens]|uniref:uncharacterized protein LOC128956149 n=1 Tax=Oppia nitens TaxID=1686743 RepID=UPI0023DAFAD6|nr:uncharacterized protein LOC128956149 [Oppia nitens]